MASHFAMRPLLRASSRPSFHHTVARLSTTSLLRTAATPEAATASTSTSTGTPSPTPSTTPAKPTPAPQAAKKVYTPKPAPAKPVPKPAPKPAPKPVSKPAPKPAPAPAEQPDPIFPDETGPRPPAPSYFPTSAAYTPGAEQTNGGAGYIDWTKSYYGLGTARFPKEVVDILAQPINLADVEVKPDGIIYLPEIKYRRILNAAFGPGGWGLVPKSDVVVGEKIVTREYALICEGRFISQAQGENSYFGIEALPSAVEGCKSNALMRCCKDLGIASELWDPVFIREFRKQHAVEVWVEHAVTKKRRTLWSRKDVDGIVYPWKRV
ncbi:hypothetical protein CMUS01_14751 [Colletotrichum musicola]|uniref:Mitochondrial genome maintenance protein MGM101 n=1 Tax=Colletotrichum musicola TaxID=2175873 RepID=A0A8H6J1V6_9PEZI|nr:hypothetical protein CMUS01_14751 [Colletotrichum musicola]